MIVRRATDSQADRDWIRTESKKGTNQIGFLPQAAIDRYIAWGDVYLLDGGGELLSFAVIRSAKQRLRIFQLWTREDVRRHHFARELLTFSLVMAKKNSERICSLWCREDIEACKFWSSMNFVATELRQGSAFRGIMQVGFERRLDRDQPLLFGCDDEQLDRSLLRIAPPSPLRGRRIVKSSEPRPSSG